MSNSNIPERMDPFGYEEDQPQKTSGSSTREKLARLQTGPWAHWVSAFTCAAAVVLMLIVPAFRAMDTRVCQAAEVAIESLKPLSPENADAIDQAAAYTRDHQKDKAIELLTQLAERDSSLTAPAATVIALLR